MTTPNGFTVVRIPLEPGRELLYGPIRHVAFVGNESLVHVLTEVRDGVRATLDQDRPIQELVTLCGDSGAPTQCGTSPLQIAVHLDGGTGCLHEDDESHGAAQDVSGPFNLASVCGAIGASMTAASPRVGEMVRLTYYGAAALLPTFAESLERYLDEQCDRLGLQHSASWIGMGPVGNDTLPWVIRHLDKVTLSGLRLPVESDAGGKFTGGPIDAAWGEMLKQLDESAFAYSLRIAIELDEFQALEPAVRFICLSHHPTSVEVIPRLSGGADTGEPSIEAVRFLDAYAAAQGVAMQLGSRLRMAGADLDERVTLCGVVPTELAVLRQRCIARGGGSEAAHCRSCFARFHCAGPCPRSSEFANWSGDDRCHVIRELIKGELLHRIAEAGGLIWSRATVGPT